MDKQENLRNYLESLPKIKNLPPFLISKEDIEPLYQYGEYSLLPVRCYTCGNVNISLDTDILTNSILHGFQIQYIMDALGYSRYCCRRTIFSSAYITKIIDYYEKLYNQYINMATNQ